MIGFINLTPYTLHLKPLSYLVALSDLKNAGDIDESEYQQIKRWLIFADESVACLD